MSKTPSLLAVKKRKQKNVTAFIQYVKSGRWKNRPNKGKETPSLCCCSWSLWNSRACCCSLYLSAVGGCSIRGTGYGRLLKSCWEPAQLSWKLDLVVVDMAAQPAGDVVADFPSPASANVVGGCCCRFWCSLQSCKRCCCGQILCCGLMPGICDVVVAHQR